MKFKCAVFDFDGTLFDSMYVWDQAGESYIRSLIDEPKDSLKQDLKTLSLYQAACYLRDEYALPLSAEEIMAGINKTVENFYACDILPKPGVSGFLKQLKAIGVRLCIATASERYHIEAALKRCGMEDCFDEIFTCSEVGHGKDEPDIFRKAMDYSGADRGTTVVFEDALHAATTAKTDGFSVAAVFDKSEDRQEELRSISDCYITDFEHTEDFWKLASD